MAIHNIKIAIGSKKKSKCIGTSRCFSRINVISLKVCNILNVATELSEPILNKRTNMVIEGQHIDHSLRTYKDSKHFTFNKTNYTIIDKEDKSANKNYWGLLDKIQQKLLEKELTDFDNKL